MPRSRRIDEGRAARGASARHAACRAARGVAVREAVPADAVDVRDRDSRAGRRRHRAAHRRRLRRSRDARGHRAQFRALGVRCRDPHVRPASDPKARGRRAASANRQRADRRGAPVPGARRSAHAEGALGIGPRPDGRVRRRRQQRRDFAGAGARDAWWKSRRRIPARIRDGRRRLRDGEQGGPLWAPRFASPPIPSMRSPPPTRSTRMCGRRWGRKTKPPSDAMCLRRIRSMRASWPTPRQAHSSCTVCRHIVGRK